MDPSSYFPVHLVVFIGLLVLLVLLVLAFIKVIFEWFWEAKRRVEKEEEGSSGDS